MRALCSKCEAIFTGRWVSNDVEAESGDEGWVREQSVNEHWSLFEMYNTAKRGCPLCSLFLKDRILPSDEKFEHWSRESIHISISGYLPSKIHYRVFSEDVVNWNEGLIHNSYLDLVHFEGMLLSLHTVVYSSYH